MKLRKNLQINRANYGGVAQPMQYGSWSVARTYGQS